MSSNTEFWQGDFGVNYIERNQGEKLLKSKEQMFRQMLARTFWSAPSSVIEFGANIGLNIRAMQRINPYALCNYSAVEVNEIACEELRKRGLNVYQSEFQNPDRPWGNNHDLTVSMGVLIHIHPSELHACYEALFEASKRWILIAEYFSATPQEVVYRGETGRLWKRDFGKDMLDLYRDRLTLLDYGFFASIDPYIKCTNDLNWWLFSKENQ